MLQKLTALVLALVIGSPTCWCCASQPAAKETNKHACCEEAVAQDTALSTSGHCATPTPAKQDDPCPCALSQTKRDHQSTQNTLPSATWTMLERAPHFEEHALLPTPGSPLLLGTGPPDGRLPIYKRHHTLLI